MKHFKRMVASVLVAVLALALGSAVALADSTSTSVSAATAKGTGNFSITMTGAEDGHTFTAYRIFDGDVDTEGKLSNITWAYGVNTSTIVADLKTAGLTLDDDATAADVATALAAQSDDSATMIKVADVFYAAKGSATGSASSKTGDDYVITGQTAGYYLVTDAYTSTADEGAATLSRNILAVVGDVTAAVKNTKPEVEKKIVENNAEVEANTANIGDTVTYHLNSTVPNMAGYKEYYMDFTDTLSKGLTYDSTSGITVSVGGTEIDEDDYTVTVGTYDATNGTTITVHLKDMVSRSSIYTTGAAIKVELKATVNDAAVIGNTGNPNKVKLSYSNNPNNSGDGTPDNDNDGVKGETPEDTVNTFVTEIELTKVDASTQAALAGAVFNIKGSQINKVLVTGERFVADASGTYYLLTDDTYTQTAPTDLTKAQYATDDSGAYKLYKKEAYSTTSEQETADVEFQAVTGSDGKIKVTGLKEGTYTFTEIQAPTGYNKLSSPIVITVTSNIDSISGETAFTWSFSKDGATATSIGTYAFTVENNSGSTLPSTGGMGTTILYIAGGIMVLLAGVYLITKRRMAKANQD